MIVLASTKSFQISLASVREHHDGLNQHRSELFNRLPKVGDWGKFPVDSITMKDLAYLTAYTGHEFALLRGKREDILFHGERTRCRFDDILVDMLMSGKLLLVGHSHPGEEMPVPSPDDRETLRKIGQKKSKLISGYSGIEVEFTGDVFEII